MPARNQKNIKEIQNDPRWASVLARDPEADDQFYYSVKTTGVYCRPSCSARPPNPENVAFYKTQEAAKTAGFQPCKRCKPEQPSIKEQHAATIESVCRFIEQSETLPNLEKLAAYSGLSTYHFHRVFKTITGLTPKAYATAHRNKRIRNQLSRSNSITDAIFDAGYNSNSRFYEKSSQVLGMTPSTYRAGGTNTKIRFAIGECFLGSILVASSDLGICAIFLGDDPEKLIRDLEDRFPKAELIGGDKKFEKTVATVIGFVEKPAIGLELPLDIQGTAFQQRVWQALRNIPAGKTVSYTELAKLIGAPKSFRAVAQACAANKIAVAIPCHRVVRNDGSLSGYRWGVERKSELLDREEASNKK